MKHCQKLCRLQSYFLGVYKKNVFMAGIMYIRHDSCHFYIEVTVQPDAEKSKNNYG